MNKEYVPQETWHYILIYDTSGLLFQFYDLHKLFQNIFQNGIEIYIFSLSLSSLSLMKERTHFLSLLLPFYFLILFLMALLTSLPQQSHPKHKHNKKQQKQKPKATSSWDQIKNILTCKQMEGSTVHDPSKGNNNGYSKMGSTCRSICSLRDVVHGNTRVVHRSDNSSPESSVLGQETSLLKRKPSGKSNGGGNYTSSSTTSRGMQFRKLSGCYECHMIVDPTRLTHILTLLFPLFPLF